MIRINSRIGFLSDGAVLPFPSLEFVFSDARAVDVVRRDRDSSGCHPTALTINLSWGGGDPTSLLFPTSFSGGIGVKQGGDWSVGNITLNG